MYTPSSSELNRINDLYFAKSYSTPISLERALRGACDVLRRSNCSGALQYIPELTWMLFLKLLDQQDTEIANAVTPILPQPYRWRDWGSPFGPKRIDIQLNRRNGLLDFVNNDLFPHLKSYVSSDAATTVQKIIGEIAVNIGFTRVDTDANLVEVINKIDAISVEKIDKQHIFPLSQIYEGLLLQLGAKSSDGGQFFTPREVVRAIVRVIAPRPGEAVYDPCCGTGGFLAEAFEYSKLYTNVEREMTVYGREKENLIYPIALANLILHGVQSPNIWHGNTLTGTQYYGGLYGNAPQEFDVVLTNPPFGGKENLDAQHSFIYKSSSTQLLFLQHVIDVLKVNGRCGIVVDEGLLFKTTDAFVLTRKKLLNTCNLSCVVSLPIGAFSNVGATIKTNLLFFTKGVSTKDVWYYDLSSIKVNKSNPLTLDIFSDFFEKLSCRELTENSWIVKIEDIQQNAYSLKPTNPNSTFRLNSTSSNEIVQELDILTERVRENIKKIKSVIV
jgi:type I restriction enzyme M protein